MVMIYDEIKRLPYHILFLLPEVVQDISEWSMIYYEEHDRIGDRFCMYNVNIKNAINDCFCRTNYIHKFSGSKKWIGKIKESRW